MAGCVTRPVVTNPPSAAIGIHSCHRPPLNRTRRLARCRTQDINAGCRTETIRPIAAVPRTSSFAMMTKSLRAAVVLAIGCLSGCFAPTPTELRREVFRFVNVGDHLSAGETRLESAGFKCGPSYEVGFEGHICGRSVSGPVLSGCAEEVGIAFDRERLRVSRIVVLGLACTGM